MAVITDDLIPKALMDQVLGEIMAPEYEGLTDTAFHCVVQLADKSFRERKHGLVDVTQAHRIIAREALWLLNKDVRDDGAWVFVWFAAVPISRQPRHALIMWKDRDGDLKTSVLIEDPIARVYRGEHVDFGGIARKALDRMAEFWRDLEIKETQTRKAAQGQPSANPNPAKAIPPDSPIA